MGKKKNSNLEKILYISKYFNGIFYEDDIRKVLKECSYDQNKTIEQLNKQKNQIRLLKEENIKLKELKELFKDQIDYEIIEMIFNQSQNNIEQTIEKIQQIYGIKRDDKSIKELTTDDLLLKFQHFELDVVLDIINQYQGNIVQAEKYLEELNQLEKEKHGEKEETNHLSIHIKLESPKDDESSKNLNVPPSLERVQTDSSFILVSLIKITLQDFLPEDAINQFLVHNYINENLSISRLEFILKQINKVITFITSSSSSSLLESNDCREDNNHEFMIRDENQILSIENNSLQLNNLNNSDENNKSELELDDILYECDENLMVIDWSFISLNISDQFIDGKEISLIDLLIFGDTLFQSSSTSLDFQDQNLLDIVKSFLRTNLSPNEMFSDDIISNALEAHNFNVDETIATLSLTLEEIKLNQSSSKSKHRTISTKSKKNSGPRQKVSYASITQTEPSPEVLLEICDQKTTSSFTNSLSNSSSTSWKPKIIVAPLSNNNNNQSNNSQSSSIYHLNEESKWRNLLKEYQQNLSNYSLSPSLQHFTTEFNETPIMLTTLNITTMISYHALIGRNTNINILLNTNSKNNVQLQFNGFNSRMVAHDKSPRVLHFSIDFHGVDVRNAVQFIHSLFEYNKNQRLNSKKITLELVIGKGIHSKNGINRLKPAIQTYLTRYNYPMNCQTEGVIILYL